MSAVNKKKQDLVVVGQHWLATRDYAAMIELKAFIAIKLKILTTLIKVFLRCRQRTYGSLGFLIYETFHDEIIVFYNKSTFCLGLIMFCVISFHFVL